MGKPSSEVLDIELSHTAEEAIDHMSKKDKGLILEALRLMRQDPLNPAYARKLRGPFSGHYRVRKGNWRIIYRPPTEGIVYVVYIRKRDESTYT